MAGTRKIHLDGRRTRPSAEGVVIPFVNAGMHYGYSVFEGIRCYATAAGPGRIPSRRTRGPAAGLRPGRGFPRSALHQGSRSSRAIHKRLPPTVLVLLHPADDLSGRRHEHGGGCGQATPDDRGLGVDSVSGGKGEGTRHPGQHLFVHAAAPEHHDDQGQGLGKLRGIDSGEDRVATARVLTRRSCSTQAGYVAECTGENIFVVRNGSHLHAVPRSPILEGITRDSLITMARDTGIHGRGRTRFRATNSISPMRYLCAARRPK